MNNNTTYIKNNKLGVGFLFRVYGIILMFVFSSGIIKADTIEVGGIMSEDQHWTSGNTYIVVQDLQVTSDLKLVIDAGVVVKINLQCGLIIDNGNLLVNGEFNDSVVFMPNYTFPGLNWHWNGIELKNIGEGRVVQIEYASFDKAEVAVGMVDCANIDLKNLSIKNSHSFAVQMISSSSCKVKNCRITDNYNGIEITAEVLEKASSNTISNCFLKNESININILRETGAIVKNNRIENNIISSGLAGIRMVNNGMSASSKNFITKNVLMHSNDEGGLGIYIQFDSTQINNNIFWDNDMALRLIDNSKYTVISNNSFYKNKKTIILDQNSTDNIFLKNTLSENINEYTKFRETENIQYSQNNIINYSNLNIIIWNFTDTDLDISENYWGTTSEEIIQSLMFDNEDDPNYGKLQYTPFKVTIDTSAPVAPVYNVKKQLVGENVKVCWQANTEADLKNYRLYFGEFNDYGFQNYLDNISDTNIILPQNFDFNDDIAVTAIDSMAANYYILNGHESPFAFAVAFPYAGVDTTVCNDIFSYDVVGSTAPFSFDYLNWSTTGDGEFNNVNLVNPQYYFGSNDMQNGSVTLIMSTIVNETVYQDSLKITILKYPSAFAGNDTIILQEDDYYITDSYASNYDSVVWMSLGDGMFDTTDIINPVYTPGLLDNESGNVILILNAFSRCGIETDSVKVTIEPYYTVKGKLNDIDRLAYPGSVVAMRLDDQDKAMAVNLQNVDLDGIFNFEKLRGGKYYFYGLPDTNNFENYAPVYYPDKLNWDNAHLIDVYSNTYDLDIVLKSFDYVLPMGEGVIKGHINSINNKHYNEYIYCNPWFENGNNELCIGGSSNITVFLYNSSRSKLLDYTLSDWQGNFYFNDLPFGNYILIAEKAGYVSFPSQIIALDNENKIIDDVLIEFAGQNIVFKLSDEVKINEDLKIYPNPVKDKLNVVSGTTIEQIVIVDSKGNKLYDSKPINPNKVIINTQHFKKGVYFIKLITAENNYVKKFIVLGN